MGSLVTMRHASALEWTTEPARVVVPLAPASVVLATLAAAMLAIAGCMSGGMSGGTSNPAIVARMLFCGEPEIVEPGVISTAATEVRLTISPDGRRMLWGTIGWTDGAARSGAAKDGGTGGGGASGAAASDGASSSSDRIGGFDIWERRRTDDGAWTAPAPAAFSSPSNDFDPSFAPDGSGVYFFSNRPGGQGGDDLYFAPLDRASGEYLPARNLGPVVNSPGDEWAPVLDSRGNLLFASNGRGGRGGQDLFLAHGNGGEWTRVEALDSANSQADDFDATFLARDDAIVFAVGDAKAGRADLHLTIRQDDGRFSAPQTLGPAVNTPDALNFGPSVSPAAAPGLLFFSSRRPASTRGRIDIYRIKLCTG